MEALPQLAIAWSAVIVATFLARIIGLTPVLYYLGAGCLLVNIGWLPEQPNQLVSGLADLGIVLIMFTIGFEEQASHFMASVKRSWGIALFGALAPFGATYAITWYLWQDFVTSLVCGLAMTATAVSLTMTILQGNGLGRSKVATRIMTSAVLDDIASLALVAIVIPIAAGDTAPNLFEILRVLGLATLFFVVVAAMSRLLSWVNANIFTNARFWARLGFADLSGTEPTQLTVLALMLFGLVLGILAHEFGFHPAVGAYLAGLILRDEYFSSERKVDNNLRTIGNALHSLSFSWIGPIFFVVLGTRMQLSWQLVQDVLPHAVVLTAAIFFAQISSAALAARYTGGMQKAASVMIGIGMIGRAELAFVVMDICYVQLKILTAGPFFTLVFTSFLLNILLPIAITLWKPIYAAEVERNAQKASFKRPQTANKNESSNQ